MKVILNVDVKYLGEEGDIKNVAKGYARNYLFPRNLAVLCTPETIASFEARKDEIEERKKAKRQDAQSIKERIEALEIKIVMPAGPNGKLYGAVTTQTLFEELAKSGFDIERRRIDLPGNSIKAVGNHTATIKLYENSVATLKFTVEALIEETKEEKKPRRHTRGRREENQENDISQETRNVDATESGENVKNKGDAKEDSSK